MASRHDGSGLAVYRSPVIGVLPRWPMRDLDQPQRGVGERTVPRFRIPYALLTQAWARPPVHEVPGCTANDTGAPGRRNQ